MTFFQDVRGLRYGLAARQGDALLAAMLNLRLKLFEQKRPIRQQ